MNSIPKTGVCALCGGKYSHYGNNPQPVLADPSRRVCDRCNERIVVPERVRRFDRNARW